MQEIRGNQSEGVGLAAGYTLTVRANTTWTSGRVRRTGNNIGSQVQDVPANSSKVFGPFPTNREYLIDAIGGGGSIAYEISKEPYDFATQAGNIEGFTGSFTLKNEDMGKVFRCEDTEDVTVIVPSYLIQGFNCGFIQGNSGSVEIAADTGATNRSEKTTISALYARGSLLVFKNDEANEAAEFLVGGDFA